MTEYNDELNKICKDAITFYGKDQQLNMVKEELSELAVVINHYQRDRAGIEDVVNEMADVHLVLRQLAIIMEQNSLQPDIYRWSHTKSVLKARELDDKIHETIKQDIDFSKE